MLSLDIYQDLMDYPKYASECDMLVKNKANDKYFFKICHDFQMVDSLKLLEYQERYDIINLKYSLVSDNGEKIYRIEYDEVRYYKLITLIMGLLYYLGDISNYNMDDCYDEYLKEINNVNQIVNNLLKQLKENPELRGYYNRIENCFLTKLVKEVDLSNSKEVNQFFDSKKDIISGKVKKLVNH